MERDLDNIARHLDKYPNFAIHTVARMAYLTMLQPEKVRAFFINDIIYGTDLDFLATASISDALKYWRATYVRDWRFLATSGTFVIEGKQVHWLNLPQTGVAENTSQQCDPLDSWVVILSLCANSKGPEQGPETLAKEAKTART